MKKKSICRIVFFAAALALLLAIASCASADTCTAETGHLGPFSFRNYINPTCTEPGQRDKYCDACGKFLGTEPIGAIGHQYESVEKVITTPTCLTPGLKQVSTICMVCKYNNGTKDVVLPALDHDWGSWNVTTPATCTTTGVETRICKRDSSHVETMPIAALGHKWDKGTITKKPTLTEEGEKKYVCENNSSHVRYEKLPVITMSNNTVCAFGPRLRDVNLYPYNTDLWYMFTPFDASMDGTQTYELVASNMYIVGSLSMTINNGSLTVNYKLNDPYKFTITLEFFTVLNRIGDLVQYEPEDLIRMGLALKKNQPINLAEKFGDDTSLVLYFCSRCDYTYSQKYTSLNYNSTAHQRLLSTMLDLMD